MVASLAKRQLTMTNATRPDMQLWLSDARGVYIPRDFATSFADRAKSVTGVSDKDWATLEAGPDDNEWSRGNCHETPKG